jgi:hypothetical protein
MSEQLRVCQEYVVDFFLHLNGPGYQIVPFFELNTSGLCFDSMEERMTVIKCSIRILCIEDDPSLSKNQFKGEVPVMKP